MFSTVAAADLFYLIRCWYYPDKLRTDGRKPWNVLERAGKTDSMVGEYEDTRHAKKLYLASTKDKIT